MSVAPPPPNKRDKGAPPTATETLNTLPASTSGEIRDTPLNFRVSKAFRKRFKLAATNRDMSQVELLEKLFEMVDNVK